MIKKAFLSSPRSEAWNSDRVLLYIRRKCLRALSGLFSPNLIDQSSCRILIIYGKTRPILLDDWPIRLGDNRPNQSTQTFGGFAV